MWTLFRLLLRWRNFSSDWDSRKLWKHRRISVHGWELWTQSATSSSGSSARTGSADAASSATGVKFDVVGESRAEEKASRQTGGGALEEALAEVRTFTKVKSNANAMYETGASFGGRRKRSIFPEAVPKFALKHFETKRLQGRNIKSKTEWQNYIVNHYKLWPKLLAEAYDSVSTWTMTQVKAYSI